MGRELEVVVPAVVVDSEYRSGLVKLAKDTDLPGFRKGRVPVSIVERRYGAALKNETSQQLINRLCQQYLEQHNLHVLELLDSKRLEVGEQGALGYSIKFELMPEVDLADLRQLSVQRYRCVVSEEDVDRELQTLRERAVSYEVTNADHAAQAGDQISCLVVFKSDDESRQTSGKLSRVLGRDGGDNMVDQWQQLLVGAKLNEQRSGEFMVSTACSEAGELAGSHCRVEVTVDEIKVPHLPELNDDFAKRFQSTTVEALRDKLRGELEKGTANCVRDLLVDATVKKVLDARWHQDPELTIEHRLDSQQHRWESRKTEITDKGEFPRDKVREYITEELRKAILVSVYGDGHPVEVSEEELQAAYREQLQQMFGSGFQAAVDFYNSTKEDKNYWMGLRRLVVGRKLLDLLTQEVSLEDVDVGYQQLVELEKQRRERELQRTSEVEDYVE